MDDIKNFDIQTFSKDMFNQAVKIMPKDISGNDADFICNVVYKFCILAGEALVKEKYSLLSEKDVVLITQITGEHTFRKSIDITRANIPLELREKILQKIAFDIFDVSKNLAKKKVPKKVFILSVEAKVKERFKTIIDKMVQKGVLSEKEAQDVISKSNANKIALKCNAATDCYSSCQKLVLSNIITIIALIVAIIMLVIKSL